MNNGTTTTTNGRMDAPESGVRVRMYRQRGLGDCFLLAFRRRDGQPFYMLIDCGFFIMTSGGAARIREIAEDIRHATGDHLDVLVATHEHYDHLSGFDSARAIFDAIPVDEIWMAWTEDLNNPLANRLRQKHALARYALSEAIKKLEAAGGDEAESLQQLAGFSQDVLGELSVRSTADLMDYVRSRVAAPKYWRPSQGPETLLGVEDVRVYFLGPPEDEDLLSRSNPSTQDSEVYEEGIAMSETTAFFQALLSAGEMNMDVDNGTELRDRGYPFDECYRIPSKEAEKHTKFGEFFRRHYGFQDESEESQPWRRIETDWLRAAGSIALKLDEDTNNTSLVLAFELVNSGRVLLFVADAQVGNWLSWQSLSWTMLEDGTEKIVTARDLLERTVLYKVGHHGSHNATLREKGLEMMKSRELVAMIPVDKEDAKRRKWAMPFDELFNRLYDKTQGRILQADTGVPEKPASVTQSEWDDFLNQTAEHDLWVEYIVLDT